MAESSLVQIPQTPTRTPTETELREMERSPLTTPQPQLRIHRSTRVMVVDKTMASLSNLIKLLPTGTVLAFQALSPSFTNHGNNCYPSNKYLAGVLVSLCAISCVFFSFTDSFTGRDGKLYYGIATYRGLFVLNCDDTERKEIGLKEDVSKFRIRWIDYIHGFFSVLVFMAVALSDSDVQGCWFSEAGGNEKALLVNLPLGAGFLASLVFLVFPTSRHGIGYTESTSSIQ